METQEQNRSGDLAFPGPPLQRDSLAQQVYLRLRHNLMRGEFLPEQAVSIRSVAGALGVSAMPVREAFTRLTAEGALEVLPNRTIRLPRLTPNTLDEITAIRLVLEGMAAERAARLIRSDELSTLEKLAQEMESAATAAAVDDYLALNARFHGAIYSAARWETLNVMIEGLWLRVGPIIRWCAPDAAHLATSMRWHHAIVAALRAGDAAGARAAIEGDLREAAADMRRTLERRRAAEETR